MSPRFREGAAAAAWRGIGGVATAFGRVLLLAAREAREADLRERLALGNLHPPPGSGPLAWFHGASVGEVGALEPLVAELQSRRPALRVLVTTQTRTGRERARRPGRVARLAPLDATGPLRRFLAGFRPALHVVVETEIWPRRLELLAAAGIPAALVSARLAPEREAHYHRLRSVYGPALARFRLVAPGSEADRDRLLRLGVPADRIGPTGNLKWDAVRVPGEPELARARSLLGELGIGPEAPLVVLASVHPGEPAPVLASLAAAGGEVPWRAVVAPRHPERFDRVAEELAAAGFPAHRASRGPAPPGTRVVLLDRMGVLRDLFPSARAAFLGGTLAPVGGHSPLEAAAAGCPVVAGPRVHHQEDLVRALEEAGGLVRVEDAGGAGRALARWLADGGAREEAGRAARAEVARRRGVADRLATLLEEWLP